MTPILPAGTPARNRGGIRLAAGLAYAAFGATFASHTTGALVAVVTRNQRATAPKLDRTHLPWLCWLVALFALVATRAGRVLAVLVWGWLGWHFLAR